MALQLTRQVGRLSPQCIRLGSSMLRACTQQCQLSLKRLNLRLMLLFLLLCILLLLLLGLWLLQLLRPC